MQGGLANLAVILVFTIIFFTLLTQRMMLNSEGKDELIKGNVNRDVNMTAPLTSQKLIENVKSNSIVQSTSVGVEQLPASTKKPSLTSNIAFNHFAHDIPSTPVANGINSAQLQAKVRVDDRIHFTDNAMVPPRTALQPTSHTAAPSSIKPKDVEFDELKTVNQHPYQSPRPGTDISPQYHTSLLLCPNQSKCIVPELQLQKKYKIYLCKHPIKAGVRFYFLAREGLLLHPNVELLSEAQMRQADYFVYLPGSAPWQKSECNDTTLGPRLIVLDEFDGHSLISPTLNSTEFRRAYGKVDAQWYYMYFKRSFVRRNDGKFTGYPHLAKPDAYPMTYALAEAYLPHHFNSKREIEISCTLRGSKHMTTRLRVQEWVAEYGESRKVKNIVTKQVVRGRRMNHFTFS